MSSILTELFAFDTNVFVFAVRGNTAHSACRELLFRHMDRLRVLVPNEVLRELRRNLIPTELRAALTPLRRAAELRWKFDSPSIELVDRYRALGAKKGDAVIAAQLEAAQVAVFVSENRHFLAEIRGLPFRVVTSTELLTELL